MAEPKDKRLNSSVINLRIELSDNKMVSEGKGRLFRREDGKYLIYVPKSLADDSMFPFKNWQDGQRTGEKNSIPVKVSFKRGVQRLIVEERKEPEKQ